MRLDWQPVPASKVRREVAVHYYATLSPGEFAVGRRLAQAWLADRVYAVGDLALGTNGTAYRCTAQSKGEEPSASPAFWTAATGSSYALPSPLDLSPYLIAVSHTSRDMRVQLAWHHEITSLPRVGAILAAVDVATGQAFWAGPIETVDERTEARGTRTLSVTARTREAGPWWRRLHWASEVYPVGTELSVLIRDILEALGLTPEEYDVGPAGRWTPHTSMQLADMPAWDMLETLALPLLAEPFVDAVGRFKLVSRDVTRAVDLELEQTEVLSISGAKASPPLTALVVEWLDSNLSKSSQQEQVLATESLTAGFFQLEQTRRTYWSDDRLQRAENTRLKIVSSVNSGLLPVATESYQQVDEFSGRLRLQTLAWVPALATASIAGLIAASRIPDAVQVNTTTGTGVTIPKGRVIEMAAQAAMLLVMMSMGTGQYEIWGEPYDYVHAVNRTEAYNEEAREWERVEAKLASDYIGDEAHARQIATHELLYRSLEARPLSVEIRDDGRIERGDILGLPSGERVYVLDYARNLSRGAAATLRVTGFQV